LAKGIPSPAQLSLGSPLAQAEGRDGFRHEPSALGTVERLGGFPQQDTHFHRQFHGATSGLSGWYCTARTDHRTGAFAASPYTTGDIASSPRTGRMGPEHANHWTAITYGISGSRFVQNSSGRIIFP